MRTFEEFTDAVVARLEIAVGNSGDAEVFYLRAKDGGAFNDYYDDETVWTQKHADQLAQRIIKQVAADDAFLKRY